MLRVQDVHFTYARAARASLAGVNIELKPGEILGLLGPNGAGKTTLISQLAGTLPLQRGDISVNGVTLDRSRRANPSLIAWTPQEYAFYPVLTVRENLRCFGAIHTSGSLAARVDAALAFTQLEAFAGSRAETLSGGLKRRLNLAIATLSESQYLLLDEPTAGVDPQSRAFMLEAIRTLAARGVGVLYSSHYMEEVEAMASYVVIIDQGKVLRQGALDDLLVRGQSLLSFTQTGLSETQLADCLRPFGQLQDPGRLLLYPGQTPVLALQALTSQGAHIRHAEFGRCNLEQVFMQLTHRSLRD